MFLAIIIIAVIIGLLFIAAAISFISFIYNSIKKNDTAKRKSFKVLLPSGIIRIFIKKETLA